MSRIAIVALLVPWLMVSPAGAYEAAVPEATTAVDTDGSPRPAAESGEPAPGWDINDPRAFDPSFGFGLDGAYRTDSYSGPGNENRAFPILSYRGQRFTALGPNLSYLLFGVERPWSIKTIMAPSFDDHDASESAFLRGMDDRDATTEGGFEASYETGLADFSLSSRSDLLSEHDGYRVDAEISRSWWLGRFIMTPEISYSYWDGARSDYYFGVRPSEAAPGRRAYDLDGTGNWGLSLMGVTNLTPRWFMLAGAKYTYYDEDIEDSPIVDKYYSYRLFFGVGYTFGNGSRDDRMDVDFNRNP